MQKREIACKTKECKGANSLDQISRSDIHHEVQDSKQDIGQPDGQVGKGKLPEACETYLKKLGNRPKFQNCIEKTGGGRL